MRISHHYDRAIEINETINRLQKSIDTHTENISHQRACIKDNKRKIKELYKELESL